MDPVPSQNSGQYNEPYDTKNEEESSDSTPQRLHDSCMTLSHYKQQQYYTKIEQYFNLLQLLIHW